ncbi:MAG TPA: FAD-binding protein, partial [Actinomycetes bacterium]|nr:FAD-binding protein [Actinomycetes bacterium]
MTVHPTLEDPRSAQIAGASDLSPIGRDDRRWNDLRRTFNLTDDLRPAAIVVPEDANGVAEAVVEAQRRGQEVAVQATGHNASAFPRLDDALVVNTSRLDEVKIDASGRR